MDEDDLRRTLTGVAARAHASGDPLGRITARRHKLESRRRTTTVASALAGVAALAVIAVQLLPTSGGEPGGFASGGTGGSNPPMTRIETRLVASSDGSQIVVWDPRTDDTTTVVTAPAPVDGEQQEFYRFVNLDETGVLRWVTSDADARSTAWELRDPLSQQAPTQIDGIDETIYAMDFLANGDLAYLANDGAQVAAYVQRAGQDAEQVWLFPEYLGRGIGQDDSFRIEWSPDGAHLMISNTYVDTAEERSGEMLIVLDAEHAVVAKPAFVTHGRFIDNTRIAFVPYLSEQGNRWRMLDLTTGAVTDLALDLDDPTAPAVSPDGKLLAVEVFDQDEVIVLDLEANEIVTTVEGAAPVWFDEDTLLTNELGECPPSCEGVEYDGITYGRTGRVHMIDVLDASPTAQFAPIPTTRDVSVYRSMAADGTEG